MSIYRWIFILWIMSFYWGLGYGEVKKTTFVPGELIIKVISPASSIIKELSNDSQIEKVLKKTNQIYRIRFSKDVDIPALASSYKSNPHIEYAHPNYLLKKADVPNDEYFSEQWALNKISAPAAWDIEKGTSGVIIAVPDTGIDLDHPDLEANIWVNKDEVSDGVDNDNNGYIDDTRGWDFTNSDNEPVDDNGHGTAISSIIAATTNNGLGIAGVCWYSKIMPIKFLDKLGQGTVIDAARAIEYAVNNGAKIINMSWGGYEDIPLLQEVIAYAYQQGCVLVGAAGNDDTLTKFYPAAYGSVTAVAAVNQEDKKCSFSNYGSWIDVCATGDNILTSSWDNSYACLDGTSFSTPFVSGLAGLILSQDLTQTNDQINVRMMKTADNVDSLNPAYEGLLGKGRLNLLKALQPPHITISPSSGTVGTSVKITGNGFEATELITISFATTPTIAMTTTDEEGSFSITFKVSAQPGGLKTITATGLTSSYSTSATFTITSQITLVSPTSGTIGLGVSVEGTGFGVNEEVVIDFGQTPTIATTTTTLAGTFNTIFIVDSQSAGTKTIVARGIFSLLSATATFTIITPAPLPDLVVRGITFNPPSPIELGKLVEIKAFITNQGDTLAREIVVRFYDGQEKIDGDKKIAFLRPGQTQSKIVRWQASRPLGTHTIRVVVDPDKMIEESNELNNQSTATIKVILLPEKGAITGKVIDAKTNKPIWKALVIAKSKEKKDWGIAMTNKYGKYIIPSLKEGQYQVVATKTGYFSQVKVVDVSAGKISQQDFSLWPRAQIGQLSAMENEKPAFEEILSLLTSVIDDISLDRIQSSPNQEIKIDFETLMRATLVYHWDNMETEELEIEDEETDNDTVVRVISSSREIYVNQHFDVQIMMDKVTDLMGAHLKLRFDPKDIEVVSIKEGEMLAKNRGKIKLFTTLDHLNGSIEIASLVIDGHPIGVTGEGVIANIRFRSKSADLSSEVKWLECDLRDTVNEKIQNHTQGFSMSILNYQDLTQTYCYPNPTRVGWIKFTNLPLNTRIKIFNIAGELVYEALDNDGNEYEWRCKNQAGKDVVSGIYIFTLTDDKGRIRRGKLGIIR